MTLPDIDHLLKEKGNPCISITIPTHRFSRDRMQDPKLIARSILKAKNALLNSAWPPDKIKVMETKLDLILEKVDHLRFQEGLAIYLSPQILKTFILPFRVEEKIVLGKHFEIRDLFYFNQFLDPYYLLTVSKKRIRLFKGSGRDLIEITNNDFPRQYVEEYEYARPSVGNSTGSSLKAFEMDKSVGQETRLISFLKSADHALDKYLRPGIRLYIAGVNEELVVFEHFTNHNKSISGHIHGNFDHDAVYPLAETAWKKIQETVVESHKKLIAKLREDIGIHLAVDGIRDTWKMANAGKGLTLLLEKDYRVTAYADSTDNSRIFLSPPAIKYEIIPDAADALIEIVKEKGGNVVILDNGELRDFNGVALLLRYR